MFQPESFYSILKYLEEKSPYILFVNETWHRESQIKTLPNRNYVCLLSSNSEERGGGVAIIYRTSLIVAPLFSELHQRNFLLARLSSVSSHPILLICIYFPPDPDRKKAMMAHLIRVIEFLRYRYSSFSIVGFGDLNSDLSENLSGTAAKEMTEALKLCNLQPCRYSDTNPCTRAQGDKSSCIDYFLSFGVNIDNLKIEGRLGKSDHMMISCVISKPSPVRKRSCIIFSKTKASKTLQTFLESGDLAKMMRFSALKMFRKLSGLLSRVAITSEPCPKTYFKSIACVEKELGSPNPNWASVRRAIQSCRGMEFHALQEKLNSLRLTNQLREYHAIIGSLLRLRRRTYAVQEIEDPTRPGEVIHEPTLNLFNAP